MPTRHKIYNTNKTMHGVVYPMKANVQIACSKALTFEVSNQMCALPQMSTWPYS